MAEVKGKEEKSIRTKKNFFMYLVGIAQADLELLTLLPQPSSCWNYKHYSP